MGRNTGLLLSLAGAGLGAAGWAAFTYTTGMECGWVAWGVGGLAGLGMALGAGTARTFGMGRVAALLAITSILAGKYSVSYLFTRDAVMENVRQLDESHARDVLAAQVYAQFLAEKKPLSPAAGEYPREVYAEVNAVWEAMSFRDREKWVVQARDAARAHAESELWGLAARDVWQSATLFDGLWLFLAASTAYRLGRGGISRIQAREEDEQSELRDELEVQPAAKPAAASAVKTVTPIPVKKPDEPSASNRFFIPANPAPDGRVPRSIKVGGAPTPKDGRAA